MRGGWSGALTVEEGGTGWSLSFDVGSAGASGCVGVGRTGRGDGGLKASSGGRGVSDRKLIDESKITSLLLRT